MTDASEPAVETAEPRVTFDYIKSNLFRTITPDGAMGGISPNGNVQVLFFSERTAIPQRVIYELQKDNLLGKEVENIGRNSIVREVEILVSLPVDVAESLIAFLQKEVEELKNRQENRS